MSRPKTYTWIESKPPKKSRQCQCYATMIGWLHGTPISCLWRGFLSSDASSIVQDAYVTNLTPSPPSLSLGQQHPTRNLWWGWTVGHRSTRRWSVTSVKPYADGEAIREAFGSYLILPQRLIVLRIGSIPGLSAEVDTSPCFHARSTCTPDSIAAFSVRDQDTPVGEVRRKQIFWSKPGWKPLTEDLFEISKVEYLAPQLFVA